MIFLMLKFLFKIHDALLFAPLFKYIFYSDKLFIYEEETEQGTTACEWNFVAAVFLHF